MKILMLVGAILLALGIAGVVWGFVDMADDRDVIDLGGESQIVLDEGDFPPIGIAGAIVGGIGLVALVAGGVLGRKSH